MESGLFTEMVLIDADKNRAEGEALDICSWTSVCQTNEDQSTILYHSGIPLSCIK